MHQRQVICAALAAAVASSIAASPCVAGPWLVAPGEYYTELSGSYVSTATFYDANGQRVALPLGGLSESRQLAWNTELGWKKRLSFRMGVPFVSSTERHDLAVASGSRTSLGDLTLGFRFGIVQGPSALAVEAGWQAPLGYNRRLLAAPGDGLQRAELGLHYGTGVGRGFLELGGAYRTAYLIAGSRTESARTPGEQSKTVWADHAVGNATLGWWVGDHLRLAGRWLGEFPVSNGEALPEVTRQLAGSNVTYRIDERVSVFGGSWHTFDAEMKGIIDDARRTRHLNQFFAGIAWHQTKLGPRQGLLGLGSR